MYEGSAQKLILLESPISKTKYWTKKWSLPFPLFKDICYSLGGIWLWSHLFCNAATGECLSLWPKASTSIVFPCNPCWSAFNGNTKQCVGFICAGFLALWYFRPGSSQHITNHWKPIYSREVNWLGTAHLEKIKSIVPQSQKVPTYSED